MKQISLLTTLMLFYIVSSQAQAPNAIPYQAVARDVSGNILGNQNISLRFSVHDVTAVGTVVYKETQSVTTNSFGLFTVNIGQGTPVTGTFAAISWATNAKFMQVEMDAAGGVTYVDMGTQQMLSVPYALFSGSSGSSSAVSGATNFVSKFTGANTIGNSTIFDNGTNVGVGNTSPSSKFSVGSTSQFQVNSSGAIGAATGIISSGAIQFSGLSTNGVLRATGGLGILSSSGGPINLASEVTGILPVLNGGTGSTTQNFVDLTTNQSISGLKSFINSPSGTAVANGTIYINPATNGGSATNTLLGLAVAGIEKFRIDASGNARVSSLAGAGIRMMQTDATGTLIPLASGTASQVLIGNGTWVNPNTLITEIDPKVASTIANKVPRWNGTTLSDGVIQDDATNIGVGVAPTAGIKLDVNGKTRSTTFQLTTTPANNYVLRSDTTGTQRGRTRTRSSQNLIRRLHRASPTKFHSGRETRWWMERLCRIATRWNRRTSGRQQVNCCG